MRSALVALLVLSAATVVACSSPEPAGAGDPSPSVSAPTASEPPVSQPGSPLSQTSAPVSQPVAPSVSQPVAPSVSQQVTEPPAVSQPAGEVVAGQPLGAGAGPGPYVARLRGATGEDISVGDAVDFARAVCGLVASSADAGDPDPVGATTEQIASVPGAPAGAPETVVDAAVRFGCPERL